MEHLIHFILLSFLIILTFYLLYYYYYYLTRRHNCTCDTCETYLTGKWKEQFDNLPDWHAHLLVTSPTRTIHIHVLNNVITAHAPNVEHMLRANFDNYPKGRPFSAILGDLLGRGIFVADGPHWKFQRKLASLELGSGSVRACAHAGLAHEVRAHLMPLLSRSLLSKSKSLDLQEVFREFSFNNICRFSFGVDPLSLDMEGLAEAFDVASRLSAERALHRSSLGWRAKRLFNVGSEKRLRTAIQKVNALALTIIRIRRRRNNNDDPLFASRDNDLLSRFMGSVSDENYLRDIVVSFLLAGRDTVASGLTTLFYLLARNPHTEARILEETNRVMGSQLNEASIIPSLEQLRDMHYLNGALHESMRLFPPVQMDSKWAQNDDILPDGTHIKKGTRVSYHPYAMGRVEEAWGPDCLEFKPERWLGEDKRFRPENPYKYPVFQAGVRVCLGKDVALLAMKTVAVALVRRFEIRLADPKWVPQFVQGLTATFKGGLPIVIRERSLNDCSQ